MEKARLNAPQRERAASEPNDQKTGSTTTKRRRATRVQNGKPDGINIWTLGQIRPPLRRGIAQNTRQMRYNITKRENTVATLVRSECIGFKALLARVRVLGFEDPYCEVENRQRSILLCTVPC